MKRHRRKKSRTKRVPKSKPKPTVERKDLKLDDLKAILERARSGALAAEDVDTLAAAVDTLATLTQQLEAKGVSIKRLRTLLFGARTEKKSQVFGKDKPDDKSESDDGADTPAAADADDTPVSADQRKTKKKRPGHGRNGASAYEGADKHPVAHESLRHGGPCPECPKGLVYRQSEPKVLVRIRGMAPLMADLWELERLRCNLCGEVFTAAAPPDVGEDKYDETATAMIGLLKYGCGLPFFRLGKLEASLGIPLPASTQWDIVARAAGRLSFAYEELIRQAAQGDVVYNDDTAMKLIELDKAQVERGRKGVFTTGIVSTGEGRSIVLFLTGQKHAGENLADVLARRAEERGPPIQMSDALPSNTAGGADTIVANCNAHARRRFVELADAFPDQCRHVIDELAKVYGFDKEARLQEMTPEQRLAHHQEHSGPVMTALHEWFDEQLEQRKVEPNSPLGDAIGYMQRHWDELTLFLREPGAPLDNNTCESALKRPILHRKNSLFYKTQNGADVGDAYMSLIHSAERCGENPFDYLVALLRHAEAVADDPAAWMPWNFRQTLAHLDADA